MNTHNPLDHLSSLSIRETFGECVQRVSDALQSRGEMTLTQLVAYLKRLHNPNHNLYPSGDEGGMHHPQLYHPRRGVLHMNVRPSPTDRSTVRAALIVLIQHEIVSIRSQKHHHYHNPPQQQTPPPQHNNNRHNKITAAAATTTLCYYYSFHPQEARRLLRYAKMVEFLKRVVFNSGGGGGGGGGGHGSSNHEDVVAASVLQHLLLAGRLRTDDWIRQCVHVRQAQRPYVVVDPRYTLREQVVEAAYQLASLGFVIPVHTPSLTSQDGQQSSDEEENEFDFDFPETSSRPPPSKRVRIMLHPDNEGEKKETKRDSSPVYADQYVSNSNSSSNSYSCLNSSGDDPAIVALLQGSAHYKNALPIQATWKVNFALFRAYQRAYQIGRLVAERYGHKVQSCGSLVTAALKFQAQRQLNPNENEHEQRHYHHHRHVLYSMSFSPNDIIKYIPKPVLQIMEKKAGGLLHNLTKAFQDLILIAEDPVVVLPSMVAASAGASTVNDANDWKMIHPVDAHTTANPRHSCHSLHYTIQIDALTEYLQFRMIHHIVNDRFGMVAARVMSIMYKLGYLESDALAERAMVPAKEMREILYRLFQATYVDLLQLHTTGGGNSSGGGGGGGGRSYPHHSSSSSSSYISYANTVYLWGIHKPRLYRKIREDIGLAMIRIRTRRQHELDIGKQWIERAQQAGEVDENEVEKDRLAYTKFCLGLERLDVAALQLDDAFMVLNDFY